LPLTIVIGQRWNGDAAQLGGSATTADPGKWIKVLPTKGWTRKLQRVGYQQQAARTWIATGTFIGQQVLKVKTGNVTISGRGDGGWIQYLRNCRRSLSTRRRE